MLQMPLIDVPVATGKATKLVVSLDAALHSDLVQYCVYAKRPDGELLTPSAMAKLMIEKVMELDKAFVPWKKKNPVTRKSPDLTTSENEAGA